MHKKLIEQTMIEIWNHRNLTVIEEVFAEDAVIHSPMGTFHSPKEMGRTVQKWLNAFPDLKIELLHTIEEADMVVSHWKAQGTHRKELFGIEASGSKVEYYGATIYRFKEGKIIEYWAYIDTRNLYQLSQIKR